MSLAQDMPVVEQVPPEQATRPDPLTLLPRPARLVIYAVLAVLVLTAAEQITDQSALTSSNTWRSALQLTIPIALAGLGGLWAERAGVINIGLEGMMVLGTWMGAWGCIHHGPWAGVAIGVVGGALGGLLHAIATVGFGVDHIVSGVAINILAAGATQFLNLEAFDSTNQSPTIPENVGRFSVWGLNDLTGPIIGNLTDSSVVVWLMVGAVGLIVAALVLHPGTERDEQGSRHVTRPGLALLRPVALVSLGLLVLVSLIEVAPYLNEQKRFGISELGRIVTGLTQDLSMIVVVGILAFPVTGLVLWRTKVGLRLRSVGEDPTAAESLGVNVYLMKFTALIVSGGLAGLGGVSLVYVFAQKFQTGQTNGRGYIGLAAMIFGNWRPGGLAAGAGLFGFTDSLSLQSAGTTGAILVVVALGSALLAIRSLITGRWRSTVIAVAAGSGTYLWFRAVEELPNEVVTFLPHLTTLLVLTFASQRLRPPAAIGRTYRRGDSG